MHAVTITAFIVAFGAAAALTALVRARALRAGALDVPNERSSHRVPTPRGGGIAIVTVSLAAIALLGIAGQIPASSCWALIGGGGAVALAGHLDDRGRIGIVGRFIIHIASAVWAVWWLDGFTDLQGAAGSIHLGIWGSVLAVVGIVWALNLFNFMDGIDGIAASQSAFMSGAGVFLAVSAGVASTSGAALGLCAASLGFLWWNWPPARIFMGDVGSGFLGYVVAVLALTDARADVAMLSAWLILGGLFAIDATVTLLRRLFRGEPVYRAHRIHAYQWQSRRWGHARVLTGCIALNLCWLLPWAYVSCRVPGMAVWAVLAAWSPLVIVALVCGAGRREDSAASNP